MHCCAPPAGDLPASLDAVQEEDGEEEEEEDQQDAGKTMQSKQAQHSQPLVSAANAAATATGTSPMTSTATTGSSTSGVHTTEQHTASSLAAGISPEQQAPGRSSDSGVGSGFRGKPRRPGGKQRMGVTFASTTSAAAAAGSGPTPAAPGSGGTPVQHQAAGVDQSGVGASHIPTSSSHGRSSAHPVHKSPKVPPLSLSMSPAASPTAALGTTGGAVHSPSTSMRQSSEGGPPSLNATFRLRGSSIRRSLMAGELLGGGNSGGGGALSPGRNNAAGAGESATSPRLRASVGGGGGRGGAGTTMVTEKTAAGQGGVAGKGGVPLMTQQGPSACSKENSASQEVTGTRLSTDGYALDQLMAASLPAPRFK
jgi:hypothetical protein